MAVGDSKCVVITGAGAGVGRAAASAFGSRGYRLVLVDVDEGALRETSGMLDSEIASVDVVADVTSDNAMRDAMAIAAQGGSIDVVLANVGVSIADKPLWETTADEVARLLAVNVAGVINTLRHSIPRMRDGGAIVITSSIAGTKARPGAAAYAASKTALLGLGRSLALELAHRTIRVNMICPGAIDTEMLRTTFGDQYETVRAQLASGNPLQRIASPSDIADTAVFLAESLHVNGATLLVDGGETLVGWPWK